MYPLVNVIVLTDNFLYSGTGDVLRVLVFARFLAFGIILHQARVTISQHFIFDVWS